MIFRVLPGLPPYGPSAIPVPASFGRTGREGYVVEFLPDTPDAWVGNFRPGLGGYSGAHLHPNGTNVTVFSAGSGYVMNPHTRALSAELGAAISRVWEVADPPGLVCDRQGLAFFRLGPTRIVWHTRRLSWDGFRDVVVTSERITGLAYAYGPPELWRPFEVDLVSGSSSGGAVPADVDHDWEHLASG